MAQKAAIMKLGKSIRLIRTLKGMTQEYVAKRSDTHQGYIGIVERCEREPSTRLLKAVCAIFEVPVSVLFQAEEGKNGPLLAFLMKTMDQ